MPSLQVDSPQPIALSWLQRLRIQFSARDLEAGAQIARLAAGADHEFMAEGPDPQFKLRHLVAPGWYMAEVALAFPTGQAQSRFYLDEGSGESEALSFGLPLISGEVSKRILRITSPARLRFDPIPHAEPFSIKHFRLVRLLERQAVSRIKRKLGRMHPLHRVASREFTLDQCWSDYNGLFEYAGETPRHYEHWIEQVEQPGLPSLVEQASRIQSWHWKPRFSIVLPTYNTPGHLLRECLNSVLNQTYPHWQLCIADDASTQPQVRDILAEFAERDARVQWMGRTQNGHISAASNSALALATGEFVVLLDHDDTLAPQALFAVTEALQGRPSAQVVYSDEDKLNEQGERCDPFFKPDWSPDLLHGQNYVSHLGVYQRELVLEVSGFRQGFEGSQDYDLLLRCIAKISDPRDVLHVPQVLYHWRMTPGSTARGHDQKDYASEAARRALQAHMDQVHPGVQVSTWAPGIYRTQWPVPQAAPLVTLIVPTRDAFALLKTCIDSILLKTTYPNYEIVVVDNQSTCPQTLAYMEQLQSGPDASGRVRMLRYDQPFNYSAINNAAVAEARGEIVGLINNDIEVIEPEWLTEMVSHAVRPDVGCVGAKLLYPDNTVQHAGVVLGIGGVANHALRLAPASAPGYFGRLWVTHNPSAVTGACLLLRKDTYSAVGGLDEAHLSVAFNDVDLCLKVGMRNLRHVCTPHALLYHHESATRGKDLSPDKRARFEQEVQTMRDRWGVLLDADPAYNPNLSTIHTDYSLSSVVRRLLLVPQEPAMQHAEAP